MPRIPTATAPPDEVEGTGDRDNDGIPNYLDAYDPSGTIYIGATGNPLSGVQVRLVHSGATLADTIQANPQTTGADGAYRFDILAGTNGIPATGTRDFTLEIVGLPAGATFPSVTYPPQATVFDASPTVGSGQIVSFSHPPNPSQPHTFYMVIRLQTGDDDVVNNHIAVDVASPAPMALPISNQACVTYDGNATQQCDTETLTLNSALGFTLMPNNSATVSPGQVATYNHTLTNTGDQTDRYTITFPGGNRGWPQTLRVIDNGGNVLATLTPGQSYTLSPAEELAPGEILTLAHILTVPNGASNGDIDTTLITAQSLTDPTLDRTVMDVTDVGAGCLDGVLFHDANNNGVRDAGETVYANTNIILRNASNVIVAQLTTGPNGEYNLGNLPQGNYTVEVDQATLPPGNPLFIAPNSPTKNVTINISGNCANGNFNIVLVDPAITKAGSVANANPGDVIVFTLAVTNPSPVNISGVVVNDVLNGLYIYNSATTTQGTFAFNAGTNTVSFDVGTLAPGQTVTMTVTVTVSPNAPVNTVINNGATLNFNEGPPQAAPPVPVTVNDPNAGGAGGGGGAAAAAPQVAAVGPATFQTTNAAQPTTNNTTTTTAPFAGPVELPNTGYRPLPAADIDLGWNWMLAWPSTLEGILLMAAALMMLGTLAWGLIHWRAEYHSDWLARHFPNKPSRRGLLIAGMNLFLSIAIIVAVTFTNAYRRSDAPQQAEAPQTAAAVDEAQTYEEPAAFLESLPITWSDDDPGVVEPNIRFAPPEIPATQIIIPRLGIDTQLVNAAVVGDTWDVGQLFDEVAHLEGTAYPGTFGNAVLAGHVQHADGLGPFRNLSQLEPGDLVVARGEDVEYTYMITEVMEVSPDAIEVTHPSAEPMVTLISCAGWNDETWSYEKRVVVRAQFKSWRVSEDVDSTVAESKWSRVEVTPYNVALEGEWGSNLSDYASDGAYLYSQDADAAIELDFEGEKLRLHYLYYWAFGMFDVYVDDKLVATIDSYKPQSLVASTDIIFLEPGKHTLRIESTGAANPDSTGATIALDAIDIYRE